MTIADFRDYRRYGDGGPPGFGSGQGDGSGYTRPPSMFPDKCDGWGIPEDSFLNSNFGDGIGVGPHISWVLARIGKSLEAAAVNLVCRMRP